MVSKRLYKIDEVDPYQRSNPFIRSGYRGSMNLIACLRSTFTFHNETVNIWTHLIGFFFFVGLLIRDFLTIPTHLVSSVDLLVLTGMLLCYQACMILSSLFHTFTCHSERVSRRCLSWDLAGITLALLATYLSGIHYAFWCHESWRNFYFITVGGIFMIAAGMQAHPKFAKEEYAHIRIGLFTVWAIYGFVPTLHYIYLSGGFSNGLVSVMFPRIMIMYGICGVAFLFYITKLPERFIPGLVDIVGHSHQWWHLLIFLALLFWHHTGVTFALFRLSTGCETPPNEDELRQIALGF